MRDEMIEEFFKRLKFVNDFNICCFDLCLFCKFKCSVFINDNGLDKVKVY